MNEREATDLLHRLAGNIQEIPPPVDRLVAGARTVRRRRRLRTVLGAATVMAIALAGAVAVWQRPDDLSGRGPTSPGVDQPTPAPPSAAPGTRLVGLGRVAVEVPQDWVVAENGCARDTGVVFRYPDTMKQAKQQGPCPPKPSDRPWAALAVGDTTSAEGSKLTGASWLQPLELNGLRVIQSSFHHGPPEFCGPVEKPIRGLRECDLMFWTSAGDTFFRITARGPAARDTIRGIRDSVRAIPDGYVAVPFIEFGTSVEDAGKMLGEVGLEAKRPQVDWPHYVTATEPEAGSVVPIASTIRLIPGDG